MAFGTSGISPGDRFGRYVIEAQLGAGGMAVVYRARDEDLGRQVALKILTVELAEDPGFRQRFIRESRVAASVDHPNIIPIYEAGESEQRLFIAMRFVRGGDVGTVLKEKGALAPGRVMNVIGPVAGALDAAHSAGIVHRDVKPANLLLDDRQDPGSHVYLTDFGITAIVAGPSATITSPGSVLGTPSYMAPEQVAGAAVTGQADQWGLACAAYELLCGSTPFAGDVNLTVLLYRVLYENPASVAALRPELPAVVDAVFARALAKSAADRYPTCGEFAAALKAALGLVGGFGVLGDAFTAAPPPQAAATAPASPGGARADAPVAAGPYAINVPLRASFRYVHEPARSDDDALPSLGNEELKAALENRLMHSHGGTFLITGFRGVGKSTLVMRALDDLRAHSAPDIVVPVSLSVARSTTAERLLFAVVRRVFETLNEEGVMDRLPPATRHALLVAYMRTSLSYTETQTKAMQQTAGLNVGLGPGKLVKEVADIAAPQAQLSVSRSRSLATEAAFLAYSETDVEYDLMRIIALVSRTLSAPPPRHRRLSRLRPRFLQRHGLVAPPRLRLVIVLDEVDKLTADGNGVAAVEELLTGTKNVLTVSGAHFLVIAGPDLQDRAVRDSSRGTGVYESVFGWRLYIPCVWDAPDRLIADIVADERPPVDSAVVEALVHYLRFKTRGMPRRLLQEVNGFVAWPDRQPHLRIYHEEMGRVRFYARMEEILRAFMEGNDQARLFPVALDEDRWRLGSYFILDWILRSDGVPFTAADLLKEGDDASFDPLLRISRQGIDQLLDHLADHGILEVIRGKDAMNTIIGDVQESVEKVYRLSGEIHHILRGLAERAGAEHAELVPEPRAGELDRFNPTTMAGPRVIAGRYEVSGIISQGALSTVHRGRDLLTGQQVAVKLLLQSLLADPVALARFRREAEISRKVTHPQVVHTLAFIDGPDEFAIISERLIGRNLQDIVRDDGVMSPGEAAGVGQVLAGALRYLAEQQVVRLDLKPANIVMADRGPVIADLGVAQEQESDGTDITVARAVVGTPAFMAPELLTGSAADPRSDIYSLGIVLYYCLAGNHPWGDYPNAAHIMNAVLSGSIDWSALSISAEFLAVLARATAPDRSDRFPDATALGDALRETPEWQGLREVPQGRAAHTLADPSPRDPGDPPKTVIVPRPRA